MSWFRRDARHARLKQQLRAGTDTTSLAAFAEDDDDAGILVGLEFTAFERAGTATHRRAIGRSGRSTGAECSREEPSLELSAVRRGVRNHGNVAGQVSAVPETSAVVASMETR